jgi:hypothetical protein
VSPELRRGRGEAQLDGRAVAEPRGYCRGEGRGDVDGEHVARVQEIGEVAEAGVLGAAGAAAGDQQADVVAGEAARLGRLARVEAAGDLERERAHARAPAATVSAAR